jgi:hypothetical protein
MLDRAYVCGCGYGCVYDSLTCVSVCVAIRGAGVRGVAIRVAQVGVCMTLDQGFWTAKQEPADEGDEKWHHA